MVVPHLIRHCIMVSFICLALVASQAKAEFSTKAKQAVLLDASTGDILFQKEAATPVPPSSMSKLMTIYMVFERLQQGSLKLSDTLPVSEKAWKKKGSKMFVGYNTSITVEDLLKGIIIQSGNDACIVIAEGLAGTEAAFAEMMNFKAKELGLEHSNFTNSTGWPEEQHYMSVMDIAKLSRLLEEKFPEYYGMFAETAFKYNGIRQFNRNTLLNKDIGVDGLKTGHTEAAGYGISISAERDGRRLYAVVNGLDSKKERIAEAEKLIEYGYRHFETVHILKKGQMVEEIDVWFGQKPLVPLVVAEDLVASLPKNWKYGNLKANIKYETPISAPVAQGDDLAKLIVTFNNSSRTIEVPLTAGEAVPKLSSKDHLIRAIGYYITGS